MPLLHAPIFLPIPVLSWGGLALAFTLAGLTYGRSAGDLLLLAAIGGFFGLLIPGGVNLLIPTINYLGGGYVTNLFTVALILLLTAVFTALYFRPKLVDLVAVAAILPYVAIIALQGASLPMFGWDVFTYWGPTAIAMVEHQTLSTGGVFESTHRHPLLIPSTIAFGFSNAVEITKNQGIWTMWMLMSFTSLLAISSYAREKGLSIIVMVGVCLTGLTTPLLENHMVLAGYAELAVGVSLLLSHVSFANWMRAPQTKYLFLLPAIYFSIVPLLMKNIGYIYSALFITAVIFSQLKARWILVFFCVFLLSILLVLWQGFIVSWGDSVLIAIRPEISRIIAGGYVMDINFPDLATVEASFTAAFLKNSSFNVYVVLISIAFWGWVTLPERQDSSSVIVCIFLSSVWILIQFTDYGAGLVGEGEDILGSRFLVPASLFIPTIFVDILSRREQRQSAVSSD